MNKEVFSASEAIKFGWQTFLLIVLGVLALGIGFLVTYPVSLLASAYVYKKLTENPSTPSITT